MNEVKSGVKWMTGRKRARVVEERLNEWRRGVRIISVSCRVLTSHSLGIILLKRRIWLPQKHLILKV